jgi:hypothetical protein
MYGRVYHTVGRGAVVVVDLDTFEIMNSGMYEAISAMTQSLQVY